MPSVMNSCTFCILIIKLVFSGATKLVVLLDSLEESSTNILHAARRSVGKHIALNNHTFDENLHGNLVKKGYTFLSHTFNGVCYSVSEGTVAFLAVSNNGYVWEGLDTETESLALPLLMTTETCGNPCAFQFNSVSEQLELVIFEYLKDEFLQEVIMLHEEGYDGLLLSELLTSNGVRMSHISVEESLESLKALESSFGWADARRLLISLSNGTKANKVLESMMSYINNNLQTEILVVGDLQKWQNILLKEKAYEVDLVVISRDSALQVAYTFAVEVPSTELQRRRDAECKVLQKQQQEIGKAILRDIQVDLNDNRCCHSQDEYILWKSFVTEDGFQSLFPVALWGNDTGWLPIRPVRFEIITLRVVSVKPSDFVNFTVINEEVNFHDCLFKDIMKYLGQRLNFRYSITTVKEMDWGRKLGNDWTGAIGLVIRGEADMIPFIPIMPSARDAIAYTKTIAFTSDGMLVSSPRESSRAFMYFKLYQIEVWISLLSTVLIITFVLRKMFRFHVGIEKPMSFPSCFWLIFGSLLQQGSTHLPRTSACRIILATWWLLVIVVTTTYSANFVAFLVSSQNKYIVKSLEELANHETVTLAINEESSILEDFKVSQDELYVRIRNVYLQNSHRFRNFTSETWDSNILIDVADSKTVLIDEISTLRRWRKEQYSNNSSCRLALLPEQFRSVPLAFGLRKRSSLLQPINDEIQKLMESGLLDLWKNLYLERDYYCLDAGSDKRPMKIDDLQEPFYLLLFGTLLGIFLLGSEMIYNKWSRNSTSRYRDQIFCFKKS